MAGTFALMVTGDFDPNNPHRPGGYPPPGYGAYPPPPTYSGSGYPVPPAGLGVEPGGLGIRFLARIIDGFLVGIVAAFLTSLFGSDDSFLGVPSYTLVAGLFSGLLMFVYFVAFEVWQGWTPAKKLLGLSVRGVGGAAKPDLRQSAVRNLFTLLQLIPCLGWVLAPIAYVVIAVTINSSPTKQGKHDTLAGGTQVVRS